MSFLCIYWNNNENQMIMLFITSFLLKDHSALNVLSVIFFTTQLSFMCHDLKNNEISVCTKYNSSSQQSTGKGKGTTKF